MMTATEITARISNSLNSAEGSDKQVNLIGEKLKSQAPTSEQDPLNKSNSIFRNENKKAVTT